MLVAAHVNALLFLRRVAAGLETIYPNNRGTNHEDSQMRSIPDRDHVIYANAGARRCGLGLVI
jgi:hypothetical protein